MATGNRLLTWNTVFKWPGGRLPLLSTAAGSVDIFTFVALATNYLAGVGQMGFA